MLVDLPCTTIECDEIWTWTALCADTKLVPSWLVGAHTVDDAWASLSDLQGRPRERVQLTSDSDLENISTIYVERQNLTMRMGMRRIEALEQRLDATPDDRA